MKPNWTTGEVSGEQPQERPNKYSDSWAENKNSGMKLSEFLKSYQPCPCCGMKKDVWLPIETAPRDGKRFIACNEDGIVVIGRMVNKKYFAADSWCGIKNTVPTYWKSLPEPPKK